MDDDLNFAMKNVEMDVKYTVKNSLAFGGINAALIFKSYYEEI